VPKFPEPPAAAVLAAIDPDIWRLAAGTVISRVYFGGGDHPTAWNAFRAFGPTSARFDHHVPPPRVQAPRVQAAAILYAALEWPACLAEVFQETRFIDRTRGAPALAVFATVGELQLLDLRGGWPTKAGASAAINSGPRPRAQRWSRAIHEAYPDVGGLVYGSSMAGGTSAVALYERSLSAIPNVPLFNRLLSDPALFPRCQVAATRFGYGLV
jgi:RES domain